MIMNMISIVDVVIFVGFMVLESTFFNYLKDMVIL